jgi:hypothetical protein
MTGSPLVIVGCTDRKSLPVHSELSLSSLPKKLTVEEAADRWVNTYKAELKSKHSVQLRHLYQGEYWKIALEIDNSYETLVASAGIGIHRLNESGIGYAATFTQSATDTVLRFGHLSPVSARKTWWKVINGRGGLGSSRWKSQHKPNRGRRTVLVAVSDGYQQALSSDLHAIADDWANVIVVSGSKPLDLLVDHPNIDHIKVGQQLRMVLGGSTPCIGVRFVHDFLALDTKCDAESVQKHLDVLNLRYQRLSPDKKLPHISRRSFGNDDEVIRWILGAINRHAATKTSKSSLLRLLRDEGRACEQKRFGHLFDQALIQKKKTDQSVSKRR